MKEINESTREIVEMEILEGLNNVDIMDRIGEDIIAIARVRHGVVGRGLKFYGTELDFQECKVRDTREFEDMITLACELFDKGDSIDYVMQKTNLSEVMIMLLLEELVFSSISENFDINCSEAVGVNWREMMTNKFIVKEYKKPEYKIVEELTPEIVKEREEAMRRVQEAEEILLCLYNVITKSFDNVSNVRLFNDMSPLLEACKFLNVPIEFVDMVRKEDSELWNSIFYHDTVDEGGEFIEPKGPEPITTYETILNDEGVPIEVVMKVDGLVVCRGSVDWSCK